MMATGWTLAWISIALAVGIMLLTRLRRGAKVIVISSVMGAVFGVLMLVGRTWERMCELSDPTVVDRCSGKYIELFGEHRLPQLMQTSQADAWLVAIAAVLGIVLADLIAVGGMWFSSQLRSNRSMQVPQDAAER
jgi:MFS family permease